MINEWIQNELNNMSVREEFVKAPALKPKENVPFEIEVNTTKPFETWKSQDGLNTKKIILVKNEGEEKIWWLNPANPTYKELLQKLTKGETKFKLIQTGTQKNTRYVFI